jgi:hypothetical protein
MLTGPDTTKPSSTTPSSTVPSIISDFGPVVKDPWRTAAAAPAGTASGTALTNAGAAAAAPVDGRGSNPEAVPEPTPIPGASAWLSVAKDTAIPGSPGFGASTVHWGAVDTAATAAMPATVRQLMQQRHEQTIFMLKGALSAATFAVEAAAAAAAASEAAAAAASEAAASSTFRAAVSATATADVAAAIAAEEAARVALFRCV